jgi:hypothetical protein
MAHWTFYLELTAASQVGTGVWAPLLGQEGSQEDLRVSITDLRLEIHPVTTVPGSDKNEPPRPLRVHPSLDQGGEL